MPPDHPDHQALPWVYALPYVALEPDLAWVVAVDGETAGPLLGYLVGCADTTRFLRRWRSRWLPQVSPEALTGESETRSLLRDPAPLWPPGPVLQRHPAHLHVDLLPSGQGSGWGRRLVDRFLRTLDERGIPGVHVGVDPGNCGAIAFYTRLGFTPLAVPATVAGTVYLGRSVTPGG